MGVPREIGRLANERGRKNERRVVAASALITDEWMSGARPATPEEDARGIDVVVLTNDMGNLYLQVKSSWCGAKIAREKPRFSCGPVEVVVACDDELRLVRRVRDALFRLRARWSGMREAKL